MKNSINPAGKTVEIEFGVVTVPLADQLAEQGLELPANELERFERLNRAINTLFLNQIATPGMVIKMRQKLLGKIAMNVKPLQE